MSLIRRAKELVQITDRGFAQLRTKAGAIIAGRNWTQIDDDEKSIIEIKGWVSIVARQNGKKIPGKSRDGFNIWTNTGREFLPQLMSIQTSPYTAFRSDQVAYIGVGTGTQPETVGVTALVQPIAYLTNYFLAPLDIAPTFPLNPSKTTVRYHIIFPETQLTLTPGSSVNISELGLYTNGSPLTSPPYTPSVGTRDRTIGGAPSQAPVAYKTFEPIQKTDSLQLEVSWEIRF